ncbi:MAG: glycosyltransferase [Gemmatimonadaceae bacterium]|nr:glycosyltransferase [Gemmatimonadaceae bacterium]
MGGAETWLVSLLEWLAHNGDSLPVEVQTEVCLTSGARAVLDDRVESLGARLHYIRYERRHLLRFRRSFRRLLSNGHFDAIHDHADYAAGIHLLCGLGALPRARVVHVHNPFATFGDSLARRGIRAAGRFAVTRLATTVAGTSMRILHDYALAPAPGLKQRRVALHCGFDLAPFATDARQARADIRAELGWPADAKVLLFVGRLESHFNQKNPGLALEIARECIARDPQVKALFVGGGDDARRAIETQLSAAGLSEAVRLCGIRFDVPRLMLASDLLLFPSIAEGLGMVAVEAQAAGLRVLASDTTPSECAVVPGLVTFVSLDEPASRWAERALAILATPAPDRDAARDAIGRSPFSIASSAKALLQAYGFLDALP